MKYLLVLPKRVILTLAMCMSFLAVFSQEHMTFQGIPIDGTIKSFDKQMKKHGFKLDLRQEEGNIYRGSYITNNDKVYVFSSSKSKKVMAVCITVNPSNMVNTESWQKVKENYDYVVNLFSEKYDTAEKNTIAYFEAPYEEGDGNEVEGIRNGKCHYSTDFNLPQGRIVVWIKSCNYVMFTSSPEDIGKVVPCISIQIIDYANRETRDIQL